MEHFAGAGRAEAVEAAVLHMDIASLDLNQVSMLKTHAGLPLRMLTHLNTKKSSAGYLI